MEALTQGLGRSEIIALLITNIVAFIIFFLVLKRFAWGPLLSMLDQRRDKVQGDYEAAEQELQKAEDLRGEFDVKMGQIKDIERERVQEAVKRGEAIANSLEKDAREKAGDFLSKAEGDLDREVATARLQLRKQTVDMAIAAAEKVIKEKLDDAKHRKMIEDFIQQLGDIRA